MVWMSVSNFVPGDPTAEPFRRQSQGTGFFGFWAVPLKLNCGTLAVPLPAMMWHPHQSPKVMGAFGLELNPPEL